MLILNEINDSFNEDYGLFFNFEHVTGTIYFNMQLLYVGGGLFGSVLSWRYHVIM